MKLMLTLLLMLALLTMIDAQDPFAMQRELQKILADDKGTKGEVERIQTLETPANPALLTRKLDEAQTAIDTYTAYLGSGKPLKERLDNLQAREPDAMKNIDMLANSARNCKKTKNFDAVDTSLISLRDYYRLPGFEVSFGFPWITSSLPPTDVEVLTKVSKLLEMDGQAFCKYVVDNEIDLNRLKQDLVKSVSILKAQTDAQISDYDKKSPRTQQVLNAWNERKSQLEKSLEQKAGTASTVANYLPWIIGAFCLFALLIFVILMRFPKESQLELIASGQVIQFATVIILLIVVCILGMAKFVGDSTLGTLLGGISGYILSQGVGRRERHEATQ